LQSALAAVGIQDFEWALEDERPYFTDKPGWEGYSAVMLAAAYADTATPWPQQLPPDFPSDRAYNEARAKGDASRFRQLYFSDGWLPVELTHTISSPNPAGTSFDWGSSPWLLERLVELQSELQISDKDLEQALGGADPGLPKQAFDAWVRFGMAVLKPLTERSVEIRLPMVLDY